MPFPGKLFIRLDHQGMLPANFCCRMSGFSSGNYHELVIKAQDFKQVEACHVFVTQEAFSFIESIQIQNMPTDAAGEIGMADLARKDILNLLPLFAGVPSTAQVNKLLSNIKIKDFLGLDGLTLFTAGGEAPSLTVPSFITVMLIEGLVRYGKYNQASQVLISIFCNNMYKQMQPPVRSQAVHSERSKHWYLFASS